MNNLPDWVLKYRTKGVEIRAFGGRYYAYEVSSKYDADLRRAKKITGKYLGAVTRNGIVRKSSITGIMGDYEYGSIALVYGIAEKTILPVLREVFPYTCMRILAYSILRLVNPLPMKSVSYLYEKTYLSQVMEESMSAGSISSMLSSLPHDSCNAVMRRLTE